MKPCSSICYTFFLQMFSCSQLPNIFGGRLQQAKLLQREKIFPRKPFLHPAKVWGCWPHLWMKKVFFSSFGKQETTRGVLRIGIFFQVSGSGCSFVNLDPTWSELGFTVVERSRPMRFHLRREISTILGARQFVHRSWQVQKVAQQVKAGNMSNAEGGGGGVPLYATVSAFYCD